MATHIYEEKISKEPTTGSTVYQEKVVESRSYYGENIVSKIIYYLLDIVEIILAVRLLLLVFQANVAAPFVNFMYQITAPFVAPFRGIFPVTGQYIVATLFAMAIYAIIAYLLVRLFQMAETSGE